MADIPQSGFRRGFRIAGLPAGHLGRAAVGLGKRIGGRPAELVAAQVQERTAAQLFQVLGELKGGALKLGQAMSAMEPFLPAELAHTYGDALTRLQEAAPPLGAGAVHGVLVDALGADWKERFASFDDQPTAAASIGQVHRATWHDGTDVAVKVQYPGVAEALTSDLRQLGRIAPLIRLGAPGLDGRALLSHLRERLTDELDYQREAAAQTAFAGAFDGDLDVFVPKVVKAGPRVLVTEWVDGTPLAEVIRTGSAEQRDRTGGNLVRFLLSSPPRVGVIHGDPHPGNFRVLPDGRLAVLDFGATEPLPSGWPHRLGSILRAGADADVEALSAAVLDAGLLETHHIDPAALFDVLDPWFAPLRTPTFRFTRPWLQQEVTKWSNPRGAASRLQRRARVPAHHVLVQRVAFGLLGVLTSLDATVAVRAEAQRWIPGFQD